MARLKSLGFELNSTTAGHEVDSFNGATTPTISSTQKHSGSVALRINTASPNTSYIQHQARGTSTNKIYFRIWLYVVTLPTADGTIVGLIDHANTNQGAGVLLTTTGTLQLIGGSSSGFGHIGSASAALSLNTWYCLELSYDDSASNAVTARLNGTQFTTATGEEMTGGSTDFSVGDIDGVGMQVYFDDIAYNDSTGSFQNSFPGQSSLLYLRPDAAGDANAFATQTGGTAGATNNFTRVNETTPDDATSFNGSSTLNQEDLLNFGASGLSASDTINVVEVHGRFRNSTADATAKITFEIEKTGSGTKTSSGTITPNSTTWRTNVAGTTLPKTAPIITYQDPDAANWTNTTVDSLQAGYKLTTGPGTAGRRIDVTNLWVIVDYTPASATTQTILGKARITASTLQTILGKARVTNTTTQTTLGKSRIQKAVAQTLAGLARIQKTTTQTILGRARITATTLQTLLGKSRITAAATQTIPGKSRITATTLQTIAGKARMQATALQTLPGLARIGLLSLQTLQGLSRISAAATQTITGLARVTASTTRTILGVGNIRATTLQTIPGKSRIQKTTTQTLDGVARVTIATIQDIPAKSRITATTLQTIPGKARVQATGVQTLTGLARLSVVVLQTILGKAHLLGAATIVTQDILGKSRVTARTTRTIKGKAMILSTVSKPPPAVILLTDGHLATRLGGNVYLPL